MSKFGPSNHQPQRQPQQQVAPSHQPDPQPAKSDSLVLTVSEFQQLSDQEKKSFVSRNGTVCEDHAKS